MRRTIAWAVLVAAISAAPAAALPTPTPRSQSHGNSLSGTVMRVDTISKTFIVRAPSGAETTLVRTSATRVYGEKLQPGNRVVVRWLAKDGKKIATSVRVESAALAAATPTAPAGTR
ncbi:MAG: hypothetical protein ABI968_04140 [Acidobacteriota bacterium]